MSQLHYGTSYLPVSAESTEEQGHVGISTFVFIGHLEADWIMCMTEVTNQDGSREINRTQCIIIV